LTSCTPSRGQICPFGFHTKKEIHTGLEQVSKLGQTVRLWKQQDRASRFLFKYLLLPFPSILVFYFLKIACAFNTFLLSLDNAFSSYTEGSAILLICVPSSSHSPLTLSMGLWNCQSAVNEADFIPAFASHSTLNILGSTET